MCRKLIKLGVVLLLLYPGISFGQEDSVFYFGAYVNGAVRVDNLSGDTTETNNIKRQLGFNILVGFAANEDTLESIGNRFYTMPSMYRAYSSDVRDDWADCMKAYYDVVQAEDDVEIGFTSTGNEDNGVIYGPTANPGTGVIFLDDLRYKLRRDQSLGSFTHRLKVDIDTSGYELNETDTLGYLIVEKGYYWIEHWFEPIDTFFVTVEDIADSIDIGTTFPPTDEKVLSRIRIGTYQRCTFGVDWYKAFNERGYELVERHEYMDNVVQYAVDNSVSGNVKYWWLLDEPAFLQWNPYKVINVSLAARNTTLGAMVFSYGMGQQSPREFIERANPEIMFPDIYPLGGGQCRITTIYDSTWTVMQVNSMCNTMTDYTGNHNADDGIGLQKSLDSLYIDIFNPIYAAAVDSGLTTWFFAQAFGERFIGDPETTYVNPNEIVVTEWQPKEWYAWRPPLRSELSAMTFMAMCYEIEGLCYYRYNSRLGDNPPNYDRGITDTLINGEYLPTSLWDHLEESISPYVKVFGETLLKLDYDTSYSVNPTRSPPSNAAVASAYASSETAHPDTGWLHIGEFNDNDTLYIMLVNRACSKGINDSTPAPPQTIWLDLKPSAIGSDYAFIINLADTAYYNTTTSTWVSIEDTTYSAKMPDGTIPFTTVLGPGEGRLFKIVRTRKRDLTYYDRELSFRQGY